MIQIMYSISYFKEKKIVDLYENIKLETFFLQFPVTFLQLYLITCNNFRIFNTL